jgi:uncharacterized protein with PQ loop repeat
VNEEILKRLDALAAKLNVTAAALWGVLIRQARIEAYQHIGAVVVSILLWYGMYRAAKYLYKSDLDRELAVPLFIVMAIAFGITLFVFFGCLASLPTELLNPEYWALKQLLREVEK